MDLLGGGLGSDGWGPLPRKGEQLVDLNFHYIVDKRIIAMCAVNIVFFRIMMGVGGNYFSVCHAFFGGNFDT